MFTNRTLLILIASILTVSGCGKARGSQSPSPAASQPSQGPAETSAETVARVHWLGKARISADTNSAYFMSIWNMPESVKLEAQTLDKLATAPWRLSRGHRTSARGLPAATNLLRPLLDDVVRAESYLEVSQATNHLGAAVFAIRLNDARAALWETNLAEVLESLTEIRPTPGSAGRQGWQLKKHDVPNLIELTRVGEWTVLGAAQDHNALLEEVLARIRRGQPPVAEAETNNWLAADLDLRQVASAPALDWKSPAMWPKISLAYVGVGTNVSTHIELDFPKPLDLDLEPWDIPTNLIHAPVTSLTALRGFKPLLGKLKAWNNLQIGAPPNQFYSWAQRGSLNQTYFSVPLLNASNEVNRISNLILSECGHAFATNKLLGFARAKDLNGLEWKGLPYLWPSLKSVRTSQGEYVLLSLFPSGGRADWPPPELPKKTMDRTNLVLYGWELTGPRVNAWLFIGQFARFVAHAPQLPFQSKSVRWLQAVAPKLHESLTRMSLSDPTRISFVRKSTIGFTGVELQLLADWLESPQFPIGLHTFRASSDGNLKGTKAQDGGPPGP